jgi:hypothetical protein
MAPVMVWGWTFTRNLGFRDHVPTYRRFDWSLAWSSLSNPARTFLVSVVYGSKTTYW